MHWESSVMPVIIPACFVCHYGLWPQSYHRRRDYRHRPLVHLNMTFELCASGQQMFVFYGTRRLLPLHRSVFHYPISFRWILITALYRASVFFKYPLSMRFLHWHWIFLTDGVLHVSHTSCRLHFICRDERTYEDIYSLFRCFFSRNPSVWHLMWSTKCCTYTYICKDR